MRRILVENARRKKREKYGGGRRRVELPDRPAADQGPDACSPSMTRSPGSPQEDPADDEGLKLRLYVGLSVEEAADALGLSRTHAYCHWTYARALNRSRSLPGTTMFAGRHFVRGKCSGAFSFPY